jgi:hypothetical protein
MIAIYMTGIATILLLAVPFLPGLRDIPRLIPVHRFIWRDGTGGQGTGHLGGDAGPSSGSGDATVAPESGDPLVTVQTGAPSD